MFGCCGAHAIEGASTNTYWNTDPARVSEQPPGKHTFQAADFGPQISAPSASDDWDLYKTVDPLADEIEWASKESTGNESTTGMNSNESAFCSSPLSLWSKDSLDTDIPADLLKGVGIDKVLEGFGTAFSSNAGTQNQYLRSLSVARLGDFISHDWQSARSGKFAALCIVYNGKAACIAAFGAGLLLVALQSDSCLGVLPYPKPAKVDTTKGAWGCWCSLVCPFVFAYVFLFWQDLRARFGLETSRVFLDKFCVDQLNPERKAQGILGLAGFLNKTDRLVICWTPRYFTRLWCVYEIAAWLHLQKPLKDVCFMPVDLASLIIMQAVGTTLMLLSYAIGRGSTNATNGIVALVMITFCPLCTHVTRRMIYHLRTLPRQLENFSLATANCFCCSVGHIMPGTGEKLQCDRQVLCRTIKKWFPDSVPSFPSCPIQSSDKSEGVCSSLSQAEYIPEFDRKIRELFGKFLLRRAGPMQIRYRYCLMMAQPYLWLLLDIMVSFSTWEVPSYVKICKVLQNLVICFCLFPISFKASFWWYAWVDEIFGSFRNTLLDACFSVVCFLPVGVFYLLMYAAILAWADARLWLRFFGICGALMFATVLMFSPIVGRACGREVGTAEEAEKGRIVDPLPSLSNIGTRTELQGSVCVGSPQAPCCVRMEQL